MMCSVAITVRQLHRLLISLYCYVRNYIKIINCHCIYIMKSEFYVIVHSKLFAVRSYANILGKRFELYIKVVAATF